MVASGSEASRLRKQTSTPTISATRATYEPKNLIMVRRREPSNERRRPLARLLPLISLRNSEVFLRYSPSVENFGVDDRYVGPKLVVSGVVTAESRRPVMG